jgi:hypothetical protein
MREEKNLILAGQPSKKSGLPMRIRFKRNPLTAASHV